MNTHRDPAREFDFFLGHWAVDQQVRQADGHWLRFGAETCVEADLDGAVLVEHWDGKTQLPWEGMTRPEYRRAISLRAFDPGERHWNIHWIDTRNRRMIPTSSGRFDNGIGDFYSRFDTGGQRGRGRIRFSDITPRSLRWSFAVEQDANWVELWIMSMSRRN